MKVARGRYGAKSGFFPPKAGEISCLYTDRNDPGEGETTDDVRKKGENCGIKIPQQGRREGLCSGTAVEDGLEQEPRLPGIGGRQRVQVQSR